MKKAVILYASVHHKNTEKVVNYIASAIDADVIDLLKNRNPSIEQYELIILASGIYFGSFHKVLLEYMKATSFEGKNVIPVGYPIGITLNLQKKSCVKTMPIIFLLFIAEVTIHMDHSERLAGLQKTIPVNRI
jgi:menaquinone-dependent protoporphyrinogen IX oxidase